MEADRVSPPGRVVERELEARQVSMAEFCQATRYSESEVQAMLRGDYVIRLYDTVVLGRYFGTSALFWEDLESKWRRFLAKNQPFLKSDA